MTWILYICLHGYINDLPDTRCISEQRHPQSSKAECLQILAAAKLPVNALALCRLEPEKK